MTVKKYPQSHLLITGNSTKIIIDPGYITFERGYKVEEFQNMDGYLITHQHSDHLDPERIKEIVGPHFVPQSGTSRGKKGKVYGNADVVGKLKQLGMEAVLVENRKPFKIGEFTITPVDLPHCKMVDGSDGPPNTGYLIDGILFHPGDGDKAPAQLISENVALPIAGPSITLDGALKFAKDLQAKLIIPIHYDSRFPADPQDFARKASPLGIEVRVLAHGEETTINSGRTSLTK